MVVVCSQSYWVDPYRLAKITENRVRLENRPDWAVFGSDVTVVSSDGILRQSQWRLTPNSPPEVAVVVIFRKESQIDPIYEKTAQTVRNFDLTGQSGCFFFMGLNQRVCAPEFHFVGARMREAYPTRLGSVHLPGDARRTRVRRSRHLPFYNPKVEGRQVTRI
ncbi:hypothetical protein CRG98_038904 [Punica granatum]|uniref:Uncharacterized protein n=1 Tax=Punica granatum TaxID=22663 RepID=A0A2I0I9L8_PUNGR|nr:hypothetical protein CRG98_038904 [Punica granatum]